MNKLIYLPIILAFACTHYDSKIKLLDSRLNTEIINAMIEHDSLDINFLRKDLKKIAVDTLINKQSELKSISISSILNIFRSLDYNIAKKDSFFILNQLRSRQVISINDSFLTKRKFIEKKFHKNPFYGFSQPIFSYDLKYAFVQYWYDCENCGECHKFVLKKVMDKWIVSNTYGCGFN